MQKWLSALSALTVAGVMLTVSNVRAQGGSIDFTKEPACQSLTGTSMGGPVPKSPRLIVVRYLGSSNHEIAYRNTVLLLNAHYARTPPARPLGFTRDDVKKVDAILVGHGHGDHMSDAPYVAQHTGAPLVGAPITAAQAKKMGLDDTQIMAVTGKGGELKKFKDITVEPMLGRHGDAPEAVAMAQTTTVPLVRLYNPKYYMPTHHDEVAAGRLDTPMEPLFLRLRDELPNVHPISPLYREPVCFDTQTKAVYVGESARDAHPGGTK